MRLETTGGQLRAALRQMNGIINRHNTIPVLGCIRFDGDRIIGTDLDCELSVALPTIGRAEGGAVIDYRGLAALARHVDADDVLTLCDQEGIAAVTFNGSDYRMASLPVSDFPEFNDVTGKRCRSDNLGLLDAMRRVRFCVSTEETRYYLNGVAFLDGPNGPIVAATDGHRLAMMPLPSMPDGARGAIVPHHVVTWLAGQKGEPEAVTFAGLVVDTEAGTPVRARPSALFEWAGARLATKLIDGTFPDVFRVVPTNATPYLTITRVQMLRAMKRLEAFTRSSGRPYIGVKLEGGAHLRCTVKTGDTQATETITHADGPTEPFEVAFNARYLIEILSRLAGDCVTFSAEGSPGGQPSIITCDGDPLRVVLMPTRV